MRNPKFLRGSRTAVILALAGCLAAYYLTAQAIAHPPIDVAASNWKFTPSKITVDAGHETTLRLTSTEGVHGIEASDLDIAKTTIRPGTFSEVTFTPKKAGVYKAHCAILCGPGHADMILTIEVKAP